MASYQLTLAAGLFVHMKTDLLKHKWHFAIVINPKLMRVARYSFDFQTHPKTGEPILVGGEWRRKHGI